LFFYYVQPVNAMPGRGVIDISQQMRERNRRGIDPDYDVGTPEGQLAGRGLRISYLDTRIGAIDDDRLP
jgi:hypothetical protein